jgi:hypothetical protein
VSRAALPEEEGMKDNRAKTVTATVFEKTLDKACGRLYSPNQRISKEAR